MWILLDKDTPFPSPERADENGIVAVGGHLSRERLIEAYSLGIFPWPHQGLPLLWFCPHPRSVLFIDRFIISRSLRKALKKNTLSIKADTDFLGVMRRCQEVERREQSGTWITNDMIAAYGELHRSGIAHSIEAYRDQRLVGGLYGIALGRIFFGESMFYEEKNASKICLAILIEHLKRWGFTLIDCQAHTDHMTRFGAEEISRTDFLRLIKKNRQQKTIAGPWFVDARGQPWLAHEG